jgi:hypothetical protein
MSNNKTELTSTSSAMPSRCSDRLKTANWMMPGARKLRVICQTVKNRNDNMRQVVPITNVIGTIKVSFKFTPV